MYTGIYIYVCVPGTDGSRESRGPPVIYRLRNNISAGLCPDIVGQFKRNKSFIYIYAELFPLHFTRLLSEQLIKILPFSHMFFFMRK